MAVHHYNTRSQGTIHDSSLDVGILRSTRSSRTTQPTNTSFPVKPRVRYYTESSSATQDSHPTTHSNMRSKLGMFLAAGGVATALYSLGQASASQALQHGVKWFSWRSFNEATQAHTTAETASGISGYIATYCKLREEAQAGYTEEYFNITLALFTLAGGAFLAHKIYQKYMQ